VDAALPASLSTRLDALSEGRSGRTLAERAKGISARYRAGVPTAQVIADEDDALAYALTRMPATYAATLAALRALVARAPDFRPTTLTDVGCGPGTASWAALAVFDGIEGLRLLDGDRFLLDLAGRLLEPEPRATFWLGDLFRTDIPRADLVVASYVLTEALDDDALTLAANLWAATDGALVIVEPGTPRGWKRLIAIRSMLINMDAVIAAPCPHALACPIRSPDWCHFAQRLPRSRAHRLGKEADAPFEDEKFAYLAAVRPTVGLGQAAPRILAPPQHGKAAISLKLCEPSGGLAHRQIARRDKAAFRAMRRAGWGDAVEH